MAGGRTATLVITVALLAGCESIPTISPDGSPYYSAIPVGSTLTLQQPLLVPIERVRVQLPRYGATANAGEYATGCSLELWTRNLQMVTIQPDRFTITRISGGITPILVARPAPVMVASYGSMRGYAWGRDDSSFLRSYADFYLQSELQPDVYRLSCGYMGDPWEVEPLTVSEIREAIGSVMQLTLLPVDAGE